MENMEEKIKSVLGQKKYTRRVLAEEMIRAEQNTDQAMESMCVAFMQRASSEVENIKLKKKIKDLEKDNEFQSGQISGLNSALSTITRT